MIVNCMKLIRWNKWTVDFWEIKFMNTRVF